MFLITQVLFIVIFSGCSSLTDEKTFHSKKTVISVIKFEDRSIGTKEYEPWRMGIPDMIMESLAVVPSFKVVSRDYLIKSVLKEQEFQLLGATDPASAVKLGNLLNASYIIAGSFSVFKNTLYINAKVLSVETGEVRYQASARGLVDSFYELQNRIALDITKGLNLTLTEEEKQRVLERYETKVVNASLANYNGEDGGPTMEFFPEKREQNHDGEGATNTCPDPTHQGKNKLRGHHISQSQSDGCQESSNYS